MDATQKLKWGAWGLSTAVTLLAIYVWGQSLSWHFAHLSPYQYFPVFGLVAFSIMWSHYIASAGRQLLRIDKQALQTYFEITSLVVLIAIVLHPAILWFQLWHDGFGLPPESYLTHYVLPSLRWAAVLGTVSLFIFLAYELRRFFGQKHWWPIMQYVSDLAMIAIFIHSINLGRNLQSGWYQIVWYFYGITLLLCLAYSYGMKFRESKQV